MNKNLLHKKQYTVHGVFIEVFEVGVLLTGESGIGKSEVALSLIDRGHTLIADDIVEFTVVDNKIIGTCPKPLCNFLEVRGVGILDIEAMFGKKSVTKSKALQLIVHLLAFEHDELHTIDRIKGMQHIRSILSHDIMEVHIPVTPGRNLTILVEAAVKNQILKDAGYDAGATFQALQLKNILRHPHER